jgi:hypothetical protein
MLAPETFHKGQPWCKLCAKAYVAANREKINAYNTKYRKENAIKTMLNTARQRAKKMGIEFTITWHDVPRHMPTVCPWLGIPLRLSSRRFDDNSPSLDRIDNRLGYVPGNVIIISLRANRIKSDATAEEVLKVGRAMRKLVQNK